VKIAPKHLLSRRQGAHNDLNWQQDADIYRDNENSFFVRHLLLDQVIA
jgi:hypothetical protein